MLLVYRLCVVLVLWFQMVTPATPEQMDFDDSHTIPGWEFIYHKEHDLLLTVNANSCYFSMMHDRYVNRTLSAVNRSKTERMVYRLTQNSAHPRAVATTLDQLRAEFHDLLANFQCSNKLVYEMPLKGDDFVREGIISSYEEEE